MNFIDYIKVGNVILFLFFFNLKAPENKFALNVLICKEFCPEFKLKFHYFDSGE